MPQIEPPQPAAAPRRRYQYCLRTLLIITTLAAAVVGLIAFVLRASDPFSGRHFERDVWVANKHHYRDNPRASMVADLRAHYLLPGTSRVKVTALLGNPDMEHASTLLYVLGARTGLRFDDDFLYVFFDNQGRLTHVEVRQH